MTIYRTVGGVNRTLKQQFRGVGGVNREIKEQYRGVGGVNRKVFFSSLTLYDSGNEQVGITGGWYLLRNYENRGTIHQKNADNLELGGQGATGNSLSMYFGTTQKINVTSYTKLKCTVLKTGNATNSNASVALINTLPTNIIGGSSTWPGGVITADAVYSGGTATVDITLDISSISGEFWIGCGAGAGGTASNTSCNCKFYKIWLE